MIQIPFEYTEYSRLVSLHIKSYRNVQNQCSACYTTVLPFSVNLVMEAHRVVLYCDDLVLSSEFEDEEVEYFSIWKAAMEKRGLKVKGKMKILVSSKDSVATVRNTLVKSVVV